MSLQQELRLVNTLAFLMFLGLKLEHQIDWSWWWVFAPFWLTPIVVAVYAYLTLKARNR